MLSVGEASAESWWRNSWGRPCIEAISSSIRLTLITGYGRFRVTIAVKKMSHPQTSLIALLLEAAETLFPGYFALVMATGVVSIALFLLGYPPLAHILVWLNWVFYACLWGLTAIRLARFRALLLEDLFNH
jgi:hypothetical protein